ncbi:hypothetical protein TNCV_1014031 [Trichonephila clavipes]|uniref:C2H2-type domain-containing protein n=1 Tax=Trichonephila clavipes TaxID=2585209 RepID=A0A8X6VXQ8_TRICX|nr:hypothetical protein TNCV_1014031 [Trichonephila clavipes]
MAEGNTYPAEEDFSYFCFPCRNITDETEKQFLLVGALRVCYPCALCGKEFEAGFKREKKCSSNTPPYRCDVCGKTFRTSTVLLHHSYKHSGQWPHHCFFCQKGFAVRSLLENHERVRNTIRAIHCKKCLKLFRGNICYKMLSDACCEKCSYGTIPV